MQIKFPVKKKYYFVNVGISNGYGFKETNSLVIKTKAYENYYKAIAETRKWEVGLIAGGGIGGRRFSYEIRGELANGMSALSELSSFSERIYFLVSYTF
jgi:hypothetical protein